MLNDRKARRAYAPGLDFLEHRTVLSSISFDGTTLSITGSDAQDAIAFLSAGPATLLVTSEGSVAIPARGDQIARIVIDAGGGDDYVDLSQLVGFQGTTTLLGGPGNDTIIGSIGTDSIVGGDGDDSLDGGDGNDSLDGGNGNDVLIGGDGRIVGAALVGGDDLLIGGPGNDSLFGGSGNDTIIDLAGSNQIDAGAGVEINGVLLGANDVVSVGAGNDTIDTGDGDDRIEATGGHNQINAGDGDDTINTGPGDDTIDAGDGRNQIDAGAGRNSIVAGSGDDAINTGNGDDTINAGPGANAIDAGAGRNSIVAGDGDDIINTGPGDDTINTGDGNNQVQAGDGHNQINAGAGNDVVTTGTGDDTINTGNGNNRIDAGEGRNSLTAGSGDDTITTGDGDDTINAGDGRNQITTDGGNNRISAGNGGSQITTGDGDNQITTGNGPDSVVTGAGNDSIATGAGNDTINAGAGDDTVNAGAGDDLIAAGAGNDCVLAGNGDDIVNGGTGADTLYGEDGNDLLVDDGPDDADLIDGGQGDDTLFGGGGDDSLNGGAGADLLNGGAGNDLLIAGSELEPDADTLNGDIGDDTLVAGGGNDSIIAGPGNDQVQAGPGDDLLDGGDGNDLLDGGSGNDTILGGDDRDTLQAGDGNDQLVGGDGVDMLLGGTGNDIMDGGPGSDYLDGGPGFNLLLVGNGRDTVNGSSLIDTITFQAPFDTVSFTSAPLNGLNFPIGTDITPPAAPAAPILHVLDDTGTVGDALTRNNTPRLVGYTEPGSTVSLFDDAGQVLGTAVSDASGIYSIRPTTALADGTHSLRVQVRDAAGNRGVMGPATEITIDTSAPATPPAPVLQPGSDSGTVGDHLTNALTPVFDVNGVEAQATVELLRNGVVVANRLGNGPITDPGVVNGAYFYMLRQIDVAGNPSADGPPTIVVVDATVPTTPPAPALQPGSDSGAVGDRITNVLAPTFDAVGVENQTTVELLRDGMVVATRVGPGAITAPAVNGDGAYPYTLRQTDAAGNRSPIGPATVVVVDVTAPMTPPAPALQPGSDSGAVGDRITSVVNPTFDVTGVEAQANVELLRDGVVVATRLGTGSISDPGVNGDGTYQYALRQTDTAGNRGPMGPAIIVVVDATVPTTPPAPVLQSASDSGAVGDRITNVLAPTFDADGVENQATVELLRDGVVISSRVGPGAITAPAVNSDGTYQYALRQVDTAGNRSDVSIATVLIVDTTGPTTPPAPVLQAASDSGTVGDHLTNVLAPVFDVAGVEGQATVELLRDGVVVASRVGPGAITDPGVGGDGTYQYALRQIDVAGNPSADSTATAITVDATVPMSPPAPSLQTASDSGRPDDRITSVVNPTFDVTGVEGQATVELLRDGVVVATRIGAGPLADPGLSSDDTYQYALRQTDTAGNRSPIGSATIVVVDATVPTTPPAPVLLSGRDSGTVGDRITNVLAPVFDVAGVESQATVELLRDGVVVASRVGPGAITDPGLSSDGTYQYTLRQTDAAGNRSVVSIATVVHVDTTGPTTPPAPVLQTASDSGTVGDRITNVLAPVFDVSGGESQATVELLRDGVVVANRVGPGPLADPGLSSDGTYQYALRQIDTAGNPSLPGPATIVVVDATVPTTPPAPVLQPGSDSGAVGDRITSILNPTFDVTGVESQATVELLRDGVVVASRVGPGPITAPEAHGDGTYQYALRQIDAAGNRSAIGAATEVVLDANVPTMPQAPRLQESSDSGPPDDRITRILAPMFDVEGVESQATVELLRDGVVVASRVGPGAITGPAVNGDGTYQYALRQTDAAGNPSTLGPATVVVVDTMVPSAPSLVRLLEISDDGPGHSDGITNAAEISFEVLMTTTGGTTELLRKPFGAPDVEFAVVASRDGSGALNDTTAAEGRYEYAARTVSRTGVVGPNSVSKALVVDRTSPIGPSLNLRVIDDTGRVGDNLTNVRRPGLSGNTEPGAVVELLDDANSVIATTTAANDGSFTILTPVGMFSGSHLFQARARDVAGNLGGPGPMLRVTIASVRGDYDGDGKTDLALFRPANSVFSVQQSALGPVPSNSTGTALMSRHRPTTTATARPTSPSTAPRTGTSRPCSARPAGSSSRSALPTARPSRPTTTATARPTWPSSTQETPPGPSSCRPPERSPRTTSVPVASMSRPRTFRFRPITTATARPTSPSSGRRPPPGTSNTRAEGPGQAARDGGRRSADPRGLRRRRQDRPRRLPANDRHLVHQILGRRGFRHPARDGGRRSAGPRRLRRRRQGRPGRLPADDRPVVHHPLAGKSQRPDLRDGQPRRAGKRAHREPSGTLGPQPAPLGPIVNRRRTARAVDPIGGTTARKGKITAEPSTSMARRVAGARTHHPIGCKLRLILDQMSRNDRKVDCLGGRGKVFVPWGWGRRHRPGHAALCPGHPDVPTFQETRSLSCCAWGKKPSPGSRDEPPLIPWSPRPLALPRASATVAAEFGAQFVDGELAGIDGRDGGGCRTIRVLHSRIGAGRAVRGGPGRLGPAGFVRVGTLRGRRQVPCGPGLVMPDSAARATRHVPGSRGRAGPGVPSPVRRARRRGVPRALSAGWLAGGPGSPARVSPGARARPPGRTPRVAGGTGEAGRAPG